MTRARKSLIIILPALCFVYGIAQTIQSDVTSISNQYALAVSLYEKSFLASTEKEERSLNKRSLLLFRELLSNAKEVTALPDSLLFNTHFTIGELEHYFGNYAEALRHYKHAIAVQQVSSLPDSMLFQPLIYSGIIHYHENRLDSAARLFREAEMVQSKYASALAESQRLYNTLGVINYETGNYRQAKFYFLKALEQLAKSDPYYTDLLVNYKINLAQIHFRLEEYDQADRIYRELLPLKRSLNDIHHNLGLISLELGAARTALYYLKLVSDTTTHVPRIYNSIGNAYLELKKYDSARYFLDKAIQTGTARNTDYIGLGLALKNSGDLEAVTGHPQRALAYYTSAMHRFYPAYQDPSISANPQQFGGVFSYINLFEVLLSKATAIHRLYETTGDINWAEEELEAYHSAFRLIDYVQRSYNSDEARLFINRSRYEVHSKPIDIAFELYIKTGKEKYLEAVYVIDQQNKASVLAVNQERWSQTASKDSTLVHEERMLKSAITRLSLQAARASDSVQISKWNNDIRDYEIRLAALQKKLTPASGSSVSNIPSIRDLQDKFLDHTTALISYHLSEDKLTTVVITGEQFYGYQQPLNRNFHLQVSDYVTHLRKGTGTHIRQESKRLFALLFHKPLRGNINRLLIIPDDELLYLPFETLQNAEGKYLVENYRIQYQYSAALLKLQANGFRNKKTLAVAPFTTAAPTGSAGFEQLPYSWKEIQPLDGMKLVDRSATKKAFLKHVNEYEVVHLATHAMTSAGAGNSFIAFHGDSSEGDESLLYTEEIYNLSLHNTQLAILSACETGAGSLERGEGVMSLSRAFSYAGCPNIITSLWKADDFSTAWISGKVHGYLDKGYPLDRAVQQAKLDYLSDAGIHPRLKHPYYWAQLVFIGNFHREMDHRLLFYVIGGVIVLLPAIFLIRKRTRSVNQPSR